MLKLEAVDFQALPMALLPKVKAHCRVEFTRDDPYLMDATARAIAEVESQTDLSINPATWRWSPGDECGSSSERYWLPKTPVRQVMMVDTAGNQTPADLGYYDNRVWLKNGATTGEYLLEVGYATVTEIAPAVLNPILLLTGTLYEQREAVQMGTLGELPDMATRLLTGLWRPAV